MRKNILSAIQAHAAGEYPKECCGLLLIVGRKEQYFPCRNTATEPNEEFRLDPEDYAAAEDLGEVIAIVHSHPDATCQTISARTAGGRVRVTSACTRLTTKRQALCGSTSHSAET